MNTQDEVIEILTKVGAILPNSHFVGTSGRHFDTYLTKDALFPHTKETARIGQLLAEVNKDLNIDVVAAPALGGIILSQLVAYNLSQLKNKEILSVFTEKTPDNNQVFTRGYDKYVNGKNVLVIEDFTTTGGSAKKVVESVKNAGGNVVRVSIMVNKDPAHVTAEEFGVPFISLAELVVENFEPEACPLCKSGVPVNTTFGHGKKFLESKGIKQ
jgi:orotate phosphoribosyltransferase